MKKTPLQEVKNKFGSKENLVKELKKLDPGVKVVVSSGYANDAILSRYEEYGFCAAVAKPWRIEELTDTLEQVMRRKDD